MFAQTRVGRISGVDAEVSKAAGPTLLLPQHGIGMLAIIAAEIGRAYLQCFDALVKFRGSIRYIEQHNKPPGFAS